MNDVNGAGFKCLVCGGTSSNRWLEQCPDYFRQIGQPVNYRVCTGCGLIQQWPIPANIDELYEEYPVHARRSKAQALARAYLQRQVYYRPKPGHNRARLLDYGCGDGVYLREQDGHFESLVGYEPGAELAERLSATESFVVYSDTDKLLAGQRQTIDIITAHYVMEHVTDLHGTMELFHHLLKPGGMVHIAVPNARSWEARLFKRKWHGLDPPRHISFPDMTTFTRLAAEHGFEPPRKRCAIFPNTLAASIVTALTGRYHGGLFQLLILPSWLVAALAPSGTEVFTLKKPEVAS